MGNYISKKENNDFERSSSKRWKKSQKPRNYYKAVSDLESEHKVPVHLHYRSRDSVEDDLFTTDEKIPCLIHLHQLAINDTAGVFRGSENFIKPTRPKSFDPNILLGDGYTTRQAVPVKSTTNMVPSPNLSESGNYSQSLLPTPKEKMEIECSQHKSEVIAVDTSGAQFERRVHLRRSQRLSTSAVRRKNQQTFRARHKTLTALPGCIANELGLLELSYRSNGMPSDRQLNSSFFGDTSVISGGSTFVPQQKQHVEIQTDDVKVLTASPIKRRLNNRHSMPNVRSVPVSPQARSKMPPQTTNTNGTFPRNNISINSYEAKENQPLQHGHVLVEHIPQKTKPFMREKTNMVEDRMSSGFWSGTESCRHSTTSDTLIQNQNVKQALQQVLSMKSMDVAKERFGKSIDGDSDVTTSTLSLNSRLSTLEDSLMSSSSGSLNLSELPPPIDQTPTADDSMCIPRSELDTSCRVDISSPKGAYQFMNPDYVEPETKLNHLTSPMNLLVLGDRRGNDGLIKIDFDSTTSSMHTLDQDGHHTSMHSNSGMAKCNSNFRTTSPVTSTHESVDIYHRSSIAPVQNEVSCNPVQHDEDSLQGKKELVDESKNCVEEDGVNNQLQRKKRIKMSKTKPVPPRRASSLKHPRYCETEKKFTYMEPSSDSNEVTTRLPADQSSGSMKPEENCLKKKESLRFSTTGSVERKRMHSAKLPATSKSSTPTRSDDFHHTCATRIAYTSAALSIAKPISVENTSPVCSTPPPIQPQQPICEHENNTAVFSTDVIVQGASPVAEVVGNYDLAICSINDRQNDTLSEIHLPVNGGSTESPVQTKLNESSKRSEMSSSSKKTVSLCTEEAQDRADTRSSNTIENSAFSSLTTIATKTDENQKETSHKTEPRKTSETLEINLSPQEQNEPSTAQNNLSPIVTSVEEKPTLECVVTPMTGNSLHSLATKPAPVSTEKLSVAIKPSRPLQPLQSNVKPTIRPKPLVFPKPRHLAKENKEKAVEKLQVGSKSQQVKDKTANARAAFFGLPFKAPAVNTAEKCCEVKVASPVVLTSSKHHKEEMFDGETDIDAADVTDSDENSSRTSQGITHFDVKLTESAAVPTKVKSSTNVASAVTVSIDKNETTMGNVSQAQYKSEKDLKNERSSGYPDMKETNKKQNDTISTEETLTTVSTAGDTLNGSVLPPLNGVDEKDSCSPTEMTAESILSPKSATDKKHDFKTSMLRLRGSLRQSSEGIKPILLSPSSLERRSYPRYSTSSLDRRRKTSSGSTSREDFKALLLQTSPKSSAGSQMSATEKLRKSMHTSKVSRKNYEDVNACDSPPDTPRPGMVSMGDIRSAMSTSRQGRRQNRVQDFRKSYAGFTSHSYKKHPPISYNGRFHARSRTPTRPMMAISEDVENEAFSDAKDEKARSVSVSDL